MRRTTAAALLLLPLLALLVVTACDGDDDDDANGGGTPAPQEQRLITFIPVTGEGRATGRPDVAYMSFSVTTRAEAVSTAFNQVQDATDRAIQAIEAAGVDAADITTTDFSIYPENEYNPETGEAKFLGYRVRNSVVVKLRALDKAGALVNQIVTIGGNLVEFSAVNFAIDDRTPLQQEAREEALADAKAKAEQTAEGMGLTLGRPIFVIEGSADVFRLCGQTDQPAPGIATPYALPSTGTGFSAGSLEISTTVQVCYQAE